MPLRLLCRAYTRAPHAHANAFAAVVAAHWFAHRARVIAHYTACTFHTCLMGYCRVRTYLLHLPHGWITFSLHLQFAHYLVAAGWFWFVRCIRTHAGFTVHRITLAPRAAHYVRSQHCLLRLTPRTAALLPRLTCSHAFTALYAPHTHVCYIRIPFAYVRGLGLVSSSRLQRYSFPAVLLLHTYVLRFAYVTHVCDAPTPTLFCDADGDL